MVDFLILDLLALYRGPSSRSITTALGLVGHRLIPLVVYRFGGHRGHTTGEAKRTVTPQPNVLSRRTVMARWRRFWFSPRILEIVWVCWDRRGGSRPLGAVVVLPALLAVLGPRVEKLRVRRLRINTSTGAWHRIAMMVMRRPIPIATAAIALLVFLGLPFLGVQFGQADDRVLPPGSEARVVGDLLRSASGVRREPDRRRRRGPRGSGSVDELPPVLKPRRVARVDALTAPTSVAPRWSRPVRQRSICICRGNLFQVIPAVDPGSIEAKVLLKIGRCGAGRPGGDRSTASLIDSKEAIFSDLPLALASRRRHVRRFVSHVRFGGGARQSVVLNLLSLSATFGSMVWIFQEGHLANCSGSRPTGTWT